MHRTLSALDVLYLQYCNCVWKCMKFCTSLFQFMCCALHWMWKHSTTTASPCEATLKQVHYLSFPFLSVSAETHYHDQSLPQLLQWEDVWPASGSPPSMGGRSGKQCKADKKRRGEGMSKSRFGRHVHLHTYMCTYYCMCVHTWALLNELSLWTQ